MCKKIFIITTAILMIYLSCSCSVAIPNDSHDFSNSSILSRAIINDSTSLPPDIKTDSGNILHGIEDIDATAQTANENEMQNTPESTVVPAVEHDSIKFDAVLVDRTLYDYLSERSNVVLVDGEGYDIDIPIANIHMLIEQLREKNFDASDYEESLINLLARNTICKSIFYNDLLSSGNDESYDNDSIYYVKTDLFTDFNDFNAFLNETYTEEYANMLLNDFEKKGKPFYEYEGIFLMNRDVLGYTALPAGYILDNSYIEILSKDEQSIEFIYWAYIENGVSPYGVKSKAVLVDDIWKLTELVMYWSDDRVYCE